MILASPFHAKLKIAEDNLCKSHCSYDQTLINGVDFGIQPSYSHLMPLNCFIDIKAKTFFWIQVQLFKCNGILQEFWLNSNT